MGVFDNALVARDSEQGTKTVGAPLSPEEKAALEAKLKGSYGDSSSGHSKAGTDWWAWGKRATDVASSPAAVLTDVATDPHAAEDAAQLGRQSAETITHAAAAAAGDPVKEGVFAFLKALPWYVKAVPIGLAILYAAPMAITAMKARK